jgi:hypothetical protein
LRADWNYESQFAPVLAAMWDRPTDGGAGGDHAAAEAACVS